MAGKFELDFRFGFEPVACTYRFNFGGGFIFFVYFKFSYEVEDKLVDNVVYFWLWSFSFCFPLVMDNVV